MIKFSAENLLAPGTITASSAEASLPADNTVQYLKQKRWRATGATSEWVKFDLGAARSIKFMAIAGHNLSSGAVVKFQMNATDAWTSPSVNVTATWNAALIIYEWTTAQSYRWIRITIEDAANPDGYVEAGIAWAGAQASPTRNARAYRIIPIDPSIIEESADGAATGAVKAKYNVFEFDFRNVDYAAFKTLWAAVGMIGHFFTIADYENAILTDGRYALTVYGTFERGPDFDSTYRDRGNVRISLKEAR